ncbi:MAG: DUF2892 domain-containing protein [Gammaproteobacteria bacterium]|jgi:hypothetical protein
MKKPPNMHPIDRSVRLIVGLICVYIGFIDISLISSRPLAIVVGLFGAINIWAFSTSRCPVYSVAHFSTAEKPAVAANDES